MKGKLLDVHHDSEESQVLFGKIAPFLMEYANYVLTCKESDIKEVKHKIQEVVKTLS